MRKKPQEFGFGVRDVQASPVDTFSPEVVQNPQASKASGYAAGMVQLSQTLAGMARQNKQYDDKTLEPLAQAVYELREQGKTDTQIEKEVSESGLTTARVIKRVRKHGGFDAFTDPAFRLTYAELEGAGAATAVETSMSALDGTIEKMMTGLKITDDPEVAVAEARAVLEEVAAEGGKGLDPFGFSVYQKRVSKSIDRRVAQATAKAQRTQELHAASLVVDDAQGVLDTWFSGGMDGDEMERDMVAMWKSRLDSLNPLDAPRAVQSVLSAADSYLDLAEVQGFLNPNVEQHAAEIDELLTALEGSLPDTLLQENPDILTDIRKIRKAHTRTPEQQEAFRQSRETRFALKPFEIANLSDRLFDEFGQDGSGNPPDQSAENYEKAAGVVTDLIKDFPNMTPEEQKVLANRMGLQHVVQVEQALAGIKSDYEARENFEVSAARADMREQHYLDDRSKRLRNEEERKVAEAQDKLTKQIVAEMSDAPDRDGIGAVYNKWKASIDTLPAQARIQIRQSMRNMAQMPHIRKALSDRMVGPMETAVAEYESQWLQENSEGKLVSPMSGFDSARLRQIAGEVKGELIGNLVGQPGIVETLSEDPDALNKRMAEEFPARLREALANERLYGMGSPVPPLDTILKKHNPVGLMYDTGAVNSENIGLYARDFAETHPLLENNTVGKVRVAKAYAQAYNTLGRAPELPDTAAVDVFGTERASRDAFKSLNKFRKETKELVDLYNSADLGEKMAAMEAFQEISWDSGQVPMSNPDLYAERYARIVEGLAAGEGAQKNELVTHFESLREMADNLTIQTNGKEEAMRISFFEFQPGQIFDGIVDSNQRINPRFSKTFGNVRVDRKTVVDAVRRHLRTNAGIANPSNSLVQEFILRSAYKYQTIDN